MTSDAIVVGSGPNGLAAAIALARAGRLGARARGARRRSAAACALGRADAARLRARRLLGDPSARRRLAVLPRRCRSPSTASSGSSRRPRSRIRSTTGRPRCSSARVTATARDARRGRATGTRRLLAPLARDAPTAARGPARAARRPAPSARASRASALGRRCRRRRSRGSRFAANARAASSQGSPRIRCCRSRRARDRGVRPHARGCSATRSAGRFARGGSQTHRRRARLVPALARRRDRDRHARRARSPSSASAARCCSTSRRASSSRLAGDRAAEPLSRGARALPLRAGRLQARLGARRADPLAGGGVRARGDRPPRRHARGDRRLGAGAVARRDRRAAVRAPRPAEPLRPDRARPAGRHTAWAYCHVPNGSPVDMTERIERAGRALRARLPRSDPRALGARPGRAWRRYNPNYVGGDINGGAATTCDSSSPARSRGARRTRRRSPGVFLCSSSTPPGGGVHGMCGYHAAQAALHQLQERR